MKTGSIIAASLSLALVAGLVCTSRIADIALAYPAHFSGWALVVVVAVFLVLGWRKPGRRAWLTAIVAAIYLLHTGLHLPTGVLEGSLALALVVTLVAGFSHRNRLFVIAGDLTLLLIVAHVALVLHTLGGAI